MNAPAPITVSPELRAVLRRLKLGKMLDTLPERLALARQNHLPHHDFLELVLSDEITRRDRAGATIRARTARLDPAMVLEGDDSAAVSFDRDLWAELTSLRFLASVRSEWGRRSWPMPWATFACRRARSVHFERADRMLKRLKAARLDMSHEAEMRKLIRVDLLVVDDFCLQAMDPTERPTSTRSSSAIGRPPP